MTGDEFKDFIKAYRYRFSGVSNMMEADASIALDWFDELAGFTIEQASTARRQMMTLKPQPYPSDHLGVLIELIQNAKPRPRVWATPQEITYSCRFCEDKGTRLVYDHRSHREADIGTLQGHLISEMVVACNECEIGRNKATRRTPKWKGDNPPAPLPLFNAGKYCECTKVGNAEKMEELLGFSRGQEWVP